MFSTIRQKLMVIYIALILIPLALVNYLAVENMRGTILKDIEMNQLRTANILSIIARNNFGDEIGLKFAIKQYPIPMEGRVLVVDSNKIVVADSYNYYEGRQIDNAEIRLALNKEEKQGYYAQEKNILQTAVPIIETIGEERTVLGVILVSVSVEAAFNQISDFRRQLMWLSFGAGSIGFFAALWASKRMAKPIEELSKAAKRIGQGNLGEEVNIKTKDEIGKLASNFNYMSKELHRIDQGRMQFIGDVSHELKTPLASMKALIDSLLYGEADLEVYKEYLGDMDSEIDRLANLVKSLLSLTKIEEIGINKGSVSVEKLVTNAVRVLHPLLEKSNVEVEISFSNPVYVDCDEERITEVFINLIDNGIKYGDPNKDVHRINIYGEKTKDEYLVSVKDNGLGIEEKDKELVFEKFYRGDFSRSRDTGGAGIGLSIVSRIISVHQWNIGVKSKLGEGTIISIRIPQKDFRSSL